MQQTKTKNFVRKAIKHRHASFIGFTYVVRIKTISRIIANTVHLEHFLAGNSTTTTDNVIYKLAQWHFSSNCSLLLVCCCCWSFYCCFCWYCCCCCCWWWLCLPYACWLLWLCYYSICAAPEKNKNNRRNNEDNIHRKYVSVYMFHAVMWAWCSVLLL